MAAADVARGWRIVRPQLACLAPKKIGHDAEHLSLTQSCIATA